MHGGGSTGERDGERRARGFQLTQHGGGPSGLRAGDGDGEWRARSFQLGQHGGGSSGLRAGDGDGERRLRGFQLGQHGGSSGASTSASASAWTTNGGNGASTRPSPLWDVSERAGSSRQNAAYLTSLMVAHFTGMGFPADKVAMALEEHAGGGDKEAVVLQWLLNHQEGSSQHGAAHLTSPMVARFIEMGFSAEKVAMALEHAGEGRDEEAVVLQWLSDHQETNLEGSSSSSDLEWSNSSSGDVEVMSSPTDLEAFDEELTESDKFLKLVEMGFTTDEAYVAIAKCGGNEPLYVLADAIYAAQIGEIGSGENIVDCQRKRKRSNNELLRHGERVSHSRPMVGFGVPDVEMNMGVPSRELPDMAEGPPYFYFENVACTLQGVWEEMSQSLYNIEPEKVDSKFFCAASRKRGYIHNLHIAGRFPLRPMQKRTIKDAFPRTQEWWPQWDNRDHLNCIQTVMAPSTASKVVRTMLTDCDGILDKATQKKVLDKCRQWNLVWVGPKTVAPLEPDEVESVLGFPKDHTRSFTNTERYRSLGNSFQVDTVAFHLSVLKAEFPDGIRVLSLFSGIGGAEVALDRLGIRLIIVVFAEISEVNKGVLRTWWEKTKQSGQLIEIGSVENVNDNKLEALVKKYGGFDLIIGGSPCNNLSGGNRYSRVGLEGEQSKLFYHYVRILKQVRMIMRKNSP